MTILRRERGARRRFLPVVVVGSGLIVLGLLVASGVVLERRHSEYGEFFPGRFPEKLTYCDGRTYLRSDPTFSAEGDVEIVVEGDPGGPVGRTPGGATIFSPERMAVVAGEVMCPTVISAGDRDGTHLVSYTLSGGP
ncbi:hypothetical protein [Parafrankia discariae]|uniref:hypothetical protein n=1 Tax=Parafrankia discariae TaxID=365528 RepID=UPI001E3B7CDD|nr:hypothetical protein [Parafrankia discariae]